MRHSARAGFGIVSRPAPVFLVMGFEAFAEEVRAQSKTNWRSAYGAPAIIKYFRDGFAAH